MELIGVHCKKCNLSFITEGYTQKEVKQVYPFTLKIRLGESDDKYKQFLKEHNRILITKQQTIRK